MDYNKDETWSEVSTLEVAICIQRICGVFSQTAPLKVENSAQTTFRFSPIDIELPVAADLS